MIKFYETWGGDGWAVTFANKKELRVILDKLGLKPRVYRPLGAIVERIQKRKKTHFVLKGDKRRPLPSCGATANMWYSWVGLEEVERGTLLFTAWQPLVELISPEEARQLFGTYYGWLEEEE